MGFADDSNRSHGEILTFERHDVDASRSGWKTLSQHERWNVLQDPRQTADETVTADRRKMVNGHTAAECRIMLHANVPAEHDRVGHNDTIFDQAIVSDVRVSHEVAIVADQGDTLVFFGTSVDGDALAEDIGVTDDDLRGRSLIGKVLWLATDHAAGEESIVSSDGGMTC